MPTTLICTKEWNVLLNDAPNTFYLRLYGVSITTSAEYDISFYMRSFYIRD